MNALLLTFAAVAAAAQPQTWTFKTGPKADVTISNVSGAITVEGTKGDEVKVEAVVAGDDSSEWTAEARADGEKVRVKACCGPCGNEHHSCKGKGGVDFKLSVPEKASLHVNAVSSAITVRGTSGPEDIHSVSGSIQIAGSESSLRIHSVSGNINLSPKALGEVDIDTVSGDVQVQLPRSPDATVHLKTVSGKLNGQRVGLGSTEKSFGKGTTQIRVKTVSGSVDAQPAS